MFRFVLDGGGCGHPPQFSSPSFADIHSVLRGVVDAVGADYRRSADAKPSGGERNGMKDRQPGRIETGTMQRRKYLCEMAVNWTLVILGALLAQGLGGLLFLYAILIPKSSMLGTAWA